MKRLTLIFNHFEVEHLGKDVFLLPYYLKRKGGYKTEIVYPRTETNKNFPSVLRGVHLFPLNMRGKEGDFFICRELNFLCYLLRNASRIDVFLRFHYTLMTALMILMYKFLNRKGKAYVKLDGYMDAEDYYRHLEDKYQCKIKEDLFVEFFKPHINEYMLGVVDELRKRGHRCVIGSNTFRPHWDYIKTFPGNPLCHFDATYASHLIHMSKPESSFWRIICEKEGFDYANTLFIDDRKENTEAATALGIDSLLYTGEDRDKKARAFFSRFI